MALPMKPTHKDPDNHFVDITSLKVEALETETLNCTKHEKAYLLGMDMAPREKYIYYGGVYSKEGEFLRDSSSLRRGIETIGPFLDAPEKLRSAKLSDTDVAYCGPFVNHFGHFLLESMPRLWWGLREGFKGDYVFTYRKEGKLPEFAKTIFNLLGILDQIKLIHTPHQFRNVFIPDVAFEIQKSYHPEFLRPFHMVADRLRELGYAEGPEKVYFSKKGLVKGGIFGEEFIEKAFVQSGYTSVSPESLSMAEQISLSINAKTIGGTTGSAMHLILFTQNKNAVYLAKTRLLNLNYPMIDQLTGCNGTYIRSVGPSNINYGLPQRGMTKLTAVDVHQTLKCLAEIGLDTRGICPPDKQEMERGYYEKYYSIRALERSKRQPYDLQNYEVLSDHLVVDLLRQRKGSTEKENHNTDREAMLSSLQSTGYNKVANWLRALEV